MMEQRGKNIQMPAMNVLERLFSCTPRRVGDRVRQVCRGLDVVSPTTVMPRANFATLRRTLSELSFMSGSGRTGSRIDPNNRASAAVNDIEEKALVFCCDSLSTNLNVEGSVYEMMRHVMQTSLRFSFIVLHCLGHGVILAVKPVFEKMPQLCSSLTRYGHLWQSGRFGSTFIQTMKPFVSQA